MATEVGIVIPFASGACSWREAALVDVLAWWEASGWPVAVGAGDGAAWVKADAVADGLGRLGPLEVVVVADADVIPGSLASVAAAVDVVAGGTYRWAVPHRLVKRLSGEATRAWRATGQWPRSGWDRPPYRGQRAGGLVVLDAGLYRDAPLDRRFVGWGHEDVAADVAWRALGGAPWRGDADLFHLWHPPARKANEAIGSRPSKLLLDRYRAAAKLGPGAVAALVAAGR